MGRATAQRIKATIPIGNRKLEKEGQQLINPSILERPIHKLVVLVKKQLKCVPIELV